MQEQLKNIFVTKEVAKLAKEKGFNEICMGFFRVTSFAKFVLPNSDTSNNFNLEACDNPENFIEAPTHFQLIRWIEETFFVRISRNNEGWWIIKEKGFEPTYIEDINMALEFALDTKKRTINQNGK